MDKAMLDLYSDYLISSFGATTATGLSQLLDGEVSHDQITRSLAKKKAESKELWQIVKPTFRTLSHETDLFLEPSYDRDSKIRLKNETHV
jgi:hypothetical protein